MFIIYLIKILNIKETKSKKVNKIYLISRDLNPNVFFDKTD